MPKLNNNPPPSTLVAYVTDQLREMIIDGRMKAGEYLPSQKELAAQFGVGLSTIREAFQKLSALGLVKSHAGKGTWVCNAPLIPIMDPIAVTTLLGELNARQAYEARSIIEVALTKLAAERANPDDIQRIWGALQAMIDAQGDEDFVDADLDFHLSVAAAGHNQLLEQFYHLTRQLLFEIVTELVALPQVKPESIRLQRQIIQAIETSDVEVATTAALAHMQYIKNLLDAYE